MLSRLGISRGNLLAGLLLLEIPCIAAIYLNPRVPGRCRVTWLVCTLLAGPIGFAAYWWLKTPSRPATPPPTAPLAA
ncbi:MAG: hypothetical protein GX442_22170 [Candidatus Riflebacteria bacterium]|nr:hypothetical protein [Candidatus Riflebacteria bacterium]